MEETDYCFSFFRKPIQNIEPLRAIGVVDVYRYVVGHYAQPQTEALRSMTSPTDVKKYKASHFEMTSPADVKKYKASHFDYCTFSGLFRKRNEKELIMHSGLMCLDFDHIENMEEVKQQILNHEYFDTELLFTSPSGNGLKWIIPVDLKGWEHFEVDYTCGFERMGTFTLFQGCCQLHPCYRIAKGGYVGERCGARLFPALRPTSIINPKYNEYVKENIFRPRLGECPF